MTTTIFIVAAVLVVIRIAYDLARFSRHWDRKGGDDLADT